MVILMRLANISNIIEVLTAVKESQVKVIRYLEYKEVMGKGRETVNWNYVKIVKVDTKISPKLMKRKMKDTQSIDGLEENSDANPSSMVDVIFEEIV